MEYTLTRDGLVRFLKGIYGNSENGVDDIYNEIYDVVNGNNVSDDEFEYITDLIMDEYGWLEEF